MSAAHSKTMSMNQTRVPAGVRTGGRFAATAHGEAELSLPPAKKHLLSSDQTSAVVNSRAAEGAPTLNLSPEQVAEVQLWVDVTGDFSYRSVRAQAEDVYARDHRYTAAEYQAHLAAGGAPESPLHPGAVRRDIEQMRKETLGAAA